MFGFLRKEVELKDGDFGYLRDGEYYFDSACQTLRPVQVIEAEVEYYKSFNACGNRTKYKWGEKVDQGVLECRRNILKLVGKSEKEYAVVFTLNTTYGINLVLQQISGSSYKRILTSDIEHNSVFLPTMTWAERYGLERKVLSRNEFGEVLFEDSDFEKAIGVFNTTSNIDGRKFLNLGVIAKELKKSGGVLMLDAAQNFLGMAQEFLNVDFDVLFSSGHKSYGPSIGFVIIKKSLIRELEHFLIGGGTVLDVQKDSFELINDEKEIEFTLELGLQNWAGIIGLNSAIKWYLTQKKQVETVNGFGETVWNRLRETQRVRMINAEPSTTISFSVDGLDSHKLALILAEQGIMCRSGYFCCHYYLKNLMKLPPQLRISFGLHNSEKDVKFLMETFEKTLTIF